MWWKSAREVHLDLPGSRDLPFGQPLIEETAAPPSLDATETAAKEPPP
jgi:hypothetical protein